MIKFSGSNFEYINFEEKLSTRETAVASYWWVNVHDDQCTSGYSIPSWLEEFPPVRMNETYDEFRPIRSLYINDTDLLH